MYSRLQGAGVGAYISSHVGSFVVVQSWKPTSKSAEEAEANASFTALVLAFFLEAHNIILEGDSKIIIDLSPAAAWKMAMDVKANFA